MLYLSFGSNNNSEDFNSWFGKNRLENPLTRKIGTGLVPDYQPVFHYFSKGRGGGALDLKPCLGAASPCVLWEVDEVGLKGIDQKEGVGSGCYQRVVVPVIDQHGVVHQAMTHLVCPDRRASSGFVPPASSYLECVEVGLREHGLDRSWLQACAAGEPCCWLERLFVYGTLMQHEPRFAALCQVEVPLSIEGLGVHGRLFDCGSYPGAVFSDEQESVITGECMHFSSIDSVLGHCDRVEGFTGFDSKSNLYLRTVLRLADDQLAWSYQLADTDGLNPIDGGDWRAYTRSK